MMGRGTATARLGIMGEQRALSVQQFCGADSCQGLRVVTLGDENLCCDHFLSRCYDFFERIDGKSGMSAAHPLAAKTKELVEDYSRRALEVSLGAAGLSNLQRARLLDILLWASDLCAGGDSRCGSPWGLTSSRPATSSRHQRTEDDQDNPDSPKSA